MKTNLKTFFVLWCVALVFYLLGSWNSYWNLLFKLIALVVSVGFIFYANRMLNKLIEEELKR